MDVTSVEIQQRPRHRSSRKILYFLLLFYRQKQSMNDNDDEIKVERKRCEYLPRWFMCEIGRFVTAVRLSYELLRSVIWIFHIIENSYTVTSILDHNDADQSEQICQFFDLHINAGRFLGKHYRPNIGIAILRPEYKICVYT
jgi:hypothetical protein